MRRYYCWRCKIEMPFLEEEEWQQVAPLLGDAVREIKAYRAKHQCDLATARRMVMSEAMTMFEALTGMPGVHFDVIFHHRLADWGPECKKCGHLFRTPRASYCANCGQKVEENA